MRVRTTLLALAACLVLIAGACGDDNDSGDSGDSGDSTTTTESSGESAATIRFDSEIQEELAAVGCHPGAADGVLGPKTDAAILAFQQGAGIEADGELGPETEAALKKAVADGETVCSSSTTTTESKTTTTTAGGGSAPCTATAVAGGLPDEGETVTNYVCADGWAAGSESGGTKFILESDDGKWVVPSQDPCGSASAGLPAVILEDGCD